ncbi:MAG: hypothetical protein EOP07_23025 [Proteobacteria bacterium]|nr:MAG: hypothetical protein EOP07_23025 [Pseudomonadota bacterium]
MAYKHNALKICITMSCLFGLSCAQPPSLEAYKKAKIGKDFEANPGQTQDDKDEIDTEIDTLPMDDDKPTDQKDPVVPGDKDKEKDPVVPGDKDKEKDPVVPVPDTNNGAATPSGNALIPAGRGAQVPWTEYQAENGKTNATVIGPNRTRYDANFIEAEAIGRKAVRLAKTGDYVSIVTSKPANSIVVRLSIPDSSGGGGISSTIGVYVNGKRVKSLAVTSKYSWVYGGEDIKTPNEPGRGQPHAFFDEARALLDNIPAGAEVKLQKDAEDNAAFYVVDLIDMEQVAAPLTMPAGYVSVADHGMRPDDGVDDALPLQKAIDAVQGTTKKLWIPAGTYQMNSLLAPGGDPYKEPMGISLKGVTLQGAGMWHTTLKGKKLSFYCWGEGGCTFKDFAMLGETDRRDDNTPDNAFNGGLGTDTVVENIWAEHFKVGMWVGTDKDQFGTKNLKVSNSRFRNLYADGINLDNGTQNSSVTNVHFRNTGDDAMALWAYKGAGDRPNSGNVVSNVTSQMPWRANCFAVYGGTSGGALRFHTLQGDVKNIKAENIDIIDSTFQGIHFESDGHNFSNLSLKNIKVSGSGTSGIAASGYASGKASMEGVTVTTSAGGALNLGGTASSFLERLSGNSGW